jgi:small subunit ribosomal protein S8
MSMTDPISDLLARIRNAQRAKHRFVEVPASRMKRAIVEILKREGYIEDFGVREDGRHGAIRIQLKYGRAGARAITGLQRVSRPGRRVYCGKDEIPKVLGGMGITILSTPKGVLTGMQCRQLGVGGEVLCSIW